MSAPKRYVNAIIELTVPLDVPAEASKSEKQAAVLALMERLLDSLPEGFEEHVGHGHWEDAEE